MSDRLVENKFKVYLAHRANSKASDTKHWVDVDAPDRNSAAQAASKKFTGGRVNVHHLHDIDSEAGRKSYLNAMNHLSGKPTEYRGVKEATESGTSAVLRFSRSMKLANRKREELVAAIASKNPERIAAKRRDLGKQRSVVSRQVGRIREDVKTLREFLEESKDMTKAFIKAIEKKTDGKQTAVRSKTGLLVSRKVKK